MSVYVDDMRVAARVGHTNARWSHLMADTRAELLAFAGTLGLRESWLQDKRSGVHFDVTDSVRRRALSLGAVSIETGGEEWCRVVSAARQQHLERHHERAGCEAHK